MTLFFVILAIGVAVGSASPVNLVSTTFSYAIDTASGLPLDNLFCLKNAGYVGVFVQVYSPKAGGTVNADGMTALRNVLQAGMRAEIFMTPNATSNKSGADQFTEPYLALGGLNVNVRAAWLKVTNPYRWSNDTASNTAFISAWAQQAKLKGVMPGIFTNWNEWRQITGDTTRFANTCKLWYWRTLGNGFGNETPPDFSDFRAFAGWQKPSCKQFARQEILCGVPVNRVIYPISGPTMEDALVDTNGNHFIGAFA